MKTIYSNVRKVSLSVAICLLNAMNCSAQCQCPASPTNIAFAPAFNGGSPLILNLDISGTGAHKNDIAWDVAPVDYNNDGIDDWLVVVGSTVIPPSTFKDAFAMKVDLNGNVGWIYYYDGAAKDDEALSVYVTSDNILLCGTSRTNLLDSQHPSFSDDVWVQKLDFLGNTVSGWGPGGHLYGSYSTPGQPNADKGYDIAEDHQGNYVIVGQGYAKNHHIVDDVQGNGDVWVFQIAPSNGQILQSKIWSDNTNATGTGQDHAESVVVDCNTGHYIVSTHCGSCEAVGDYPLLVMTDAVLLDFDPADLHAFNYPHKYPYGTTMNDQNSYSIIQSFDNTFGSCTLGDGFMSLGIIHQCFNNSHNLYGIKTKNDLSPTGFIVNCMGNNGVTHGGALTDNGFDAVQARDGYLLAGKTLSNKLDNDPTGEVSCNHYDCNAITTTFDFWLAHVNACTGTLDWDESIGTTSNDVCYGITRLSDDSYVMVGYTTANTDADIYIVRFTINKCIAPVNPSSSNTGCKLDFYWDDTRCNPYHLQYKKNNVSWLNATDVYTNVSEAHPIIMPPGVFNWRVATVCTPTLSSSWTYGLPVTVTSCKIGEWGDDGVNKDLLTVYPNPAEGSFEISLQASDHSNGSATIEILDHLGKVVSTEKAALEEGLLHISKSVHLPQGYYLVRAKTEGSTTIAKLIIQNH